MGAEGAGEGKLTGHVTYPDGSSADLQCVKKENGSHSILITPQVCVNSSSLVVTTTQMLLL